MSLGNRTSCGYGTRERDFRVKGRRTEKKEAVEGKEATR